MTILDFSTISFINDISHSNNTENEEAYLEDSLKEQKNWKNLFA